jgi:hypothetical protein
MVKFTQQLTQVSDNEFTIELIQDPNHPNLGDNPIWSVFQEWFDLKDLGPITQFLSYNDDRPARDQFNEAYSHAGGWLPISGFVRRSPESLYIQYPGDPELVPLAITYLGAECIAFYPGSWVGIFQDDGTFEVARLN